MIIEDIVSDTFVAHEHLAPDGAVVLDDIRRELTTRRRRRVSRSLAALGASCAVAALAVAADVNRDVRHLPAVAHDGASTGGAVSPTSPSPSPTSSAIRSHRGLYLTVGPGWLPGSRPREVVTDRLNGAQLRGYDTYVNGVELYILVGLRDQAALSTHNKRGEPMDLRIGGRPAREWSVDRFYYLEVKPSSARVASVDIEVMSDGDAGRTGTAVGLSELGRQVARQLEFNRHDPLLPGSGSTVSPGGTDSRSS
jgi:hypothetical protein